MSNKAARSTLTPEGWIAAATDVLIDRGIDALRVDVLAKALDVTRGSFYWHFKDREALLVAVLNAWRDAATEQVIERFEGQQADPQALISSPIKACGSACWPSKRSITCSVAASRQALSTATSSASRSLKCQ